MHVCEHIFEGKEVQASLIEFSASSKRLKTTIEDEGVNGCRSEVTTTFVETGTELRVTVLSKL